jgi:hypothetical protein
MPVNTINRLFIVIPRNDPNCYMGEKMDALVCECSNSLGRAAWERILSAL